MFKKLFQNQLTEEIESRKNKTATEKTWSRIWRDFWITFGFIFATNLMGFGAIFYHQISDKVTPIFWALSCLAAGGIIGFLFGIPRVLQDNNAAVAVTKNGEEKSDLTRTAQSAYRMQVNTNLEQISDWLTKIIVGVGLIELRRLPEALTSLSLFLAGGVDSSSQTQVLASTIIVYFTMVGFLGAYLMTRIYLAQAFSRADWGTQNTTIVGGQELTFEEFSVQLRQQTDDIRQQLIKVQTEVENPTPNKTVDKNLVVVNQTKVKSILWVDDHPKNNSLDIENLEKKGIEVVLSFTTDDALKKLTSSKTFDRIISDMSRRMNGKYEDKAGINLLKAVRSQGKDTPFLIYCTENSVLRYKQEAIESGVTIITSSSTELMKALQLDS